MKEPDITVEDKRQEDHMEVKTPGQEQAKSGDTIEDLATSVKEFAAKIPGSISKAVERAISGRDLPLMIRVDDETLKRIDQLVEAGIFTSRSESAAFLISQGIKTQAAVFEQIESKIKEIDSLRQELKQLIHPDISRSPSQHES